MREYFHLQNFKVDVYPCCCFKHETTKKYDCLIIQTALLHAQIQQKQNTTDLQICMKNYYIHGACCKAKLIKLIDFYSQSNKMK